MTTPVFTWRAQVRVYECDALDHVNNAVYLHYIQQATVEAWASLGATDWELRSLAMEYVAPARCGDWLEVEATATGLEGDLLVCSYRIMRLTDMRGVVHARAGWASPSHRRDVLSVLCRSSSPILLDTVAPLRLPPDRLRAHQYCWGHTVCAYELGGSGCVNPVHLLRWVEEAKYVACAEVGWSLERMFDNDLMIVQIRHDSEFCGPLRAGERVEVISRIRDLRLLKGTWSHEVYRLPPARSEAESRSEIVALDYSTGAFLTRAGRPNPAPKAMLDALLRGEP